MRGVLWGCVIGISFFNGRIPTPVNKFPGRERVTFREIENLPTLP